LLQFGADEFYLSLAPLRLIPNTINNETATPQKLGCDLAFLQEIRGVQLFLCAG
jgi:hypothetical protein